MSTTEENKVLPERHITNIKLPEDFHDFDTLCIEAFGETVNQSLEMHQWLFDENPYNPKGQNLMFIMKENDKIIASDGLVPFELYINGKTYLGAHSVKSITHSDFKRQGIFRTMTQNSVDMGEKSGVDIIIGLANKNSYPAYENFGWLTLFEKEVYIKPIRIAKKLKAKLKLGILASVGNAIFMAQDKAKIFFSSKIKKYGVEVIALDKVPKEVENCWNEYKGKYSVCIKRDFKYLDYRYNQRPDVNYKTLLLKISEKVIGFVVLRETEVNGSKIVSVAENFTDPENESYIGAMVEAIIDYCRGCGAVYFVVGTGLTGKYKDVMLKYGMLKNKKSLSNNMMVARVINHDITIEDISGHDKWHITQGDGETELDL